VAVHTGAEEYRQERHGSEIAAETTPRLLRLEVNTEGVEIHLRSKRSFPKSKWGPQQAKYYGLLGSGNGAHTGNVGGWLNNLGRDRERQE
jgi:hypothetical protein